MFLRLMGRTYAPCLLEAYWEDSRRGTPSSRSLLDTDTSIVNTIKELFVPTRPPAHDPYAINHRLIAPRTKLLLRLPSYSGTKKSSSQAYITSSVLTPANYSTKATKSWMPADLAQTAYGPTIPDPNLKSRSYLPKPERISGGPTQCPPAHPKFNKRHPIPLGGPSPFRPSSVREEPTQQHQAPEHPNPMSPRPPLINPYIMRQLERLVDEGEEEEIILYLAAHPTTKAMAARDESEQESTLVRRSQPQAVVNQRAYDRFAQDCRLLSPPERRRRM
ncbi:hypothetical protein DXG01_008534 [Tephrocybe rancida]|nr:hypothetical protein DXG01_008534 [Tephrocybe rancida]